MVVAQMAAVKGIPIIALAGAVGEGAEKLNELGITSYFSIINGPISLEEAIDAEVALSNMKENGSTIVWIDWGC